MKGSVSRRCACRDASTGKQLGQTCPKLGQRRHGNWSIRQELPAGATGNRRTFRRGSYASATEAQTDLDAVRALLAIPGKDDPEGQQRIGDLLEQVCSGREPLPEIGDVQRKFRAGHSLTQHLTVGEWLDEWIAGRKIRRSTINRYTRDIRLHLKPYIGRIWLDKLRVADLTKMFNDIIERNMEIEEANALRRAAVAEMKGLRGRERVCARQALDEMPPFRKTAGPTTRKHIRATLRVALNAAITAEHRTFNPAKFVELDPVHRPKGLVWTAERIERYRKTGEKPSPVMVWTPLQTGAFLDAITYDEYYALFHLVALRGLRRGEACGMRWEDVDLKARTITVATQLVETDKEVEESAPKSEAGDRVVALDAGTVAVLRWHRAQQDEARLAAGAAWIDTGRVFVTATGAWLQPAWLSDHFERLVSRTDLPPVRLHDLRHGAATIALAAGVEMKLVQELLGHATVSFTSDQYTSVLPELALAAAEASARLVPLRTATSRRGLTSGTQQGKGSTETNAQDRSGRKKRQVKAAS